MDLRKSLGTAKSSLNQTSFSLFLHFRKVKFLLKSKNFLKSIYLKLKIYCIRLNSKSSTFLEIWRNFILILVCNLQVKKFKKFKSYDPEVQLCLVVFFSSWKQFITKSRALNEICTSWISLAVFIFKNVSFLKIWPSFLKSYQILLKLCQQNRVPLWSYGQKYTRSQTSSFKLHNWGHPIARPHPTIFYTVVSLNWKTKDYFTAMNLCLTLSS